MDLHLKKERYVVSTKNHDLPRESEAVKASTKSKLAAQQAAEKKNGEPWYFTHC